MARQKIYNSRITQIYAKHYARRNLSRRCAKMSLWAETELGDEVWITTRKGIGTRRINTKLEELESEYKDMLGKEISYILKPSRSGWNMIGFIRYTPMSRNSKKIKYLNMGEGI
jgi:hypothetical protein